ncbi:hypothetical protein ABKN59_001617 [Abortiporus biennis]
MYLLLNCYGIDLFYLTQSRSRVEWSVIGPGSNVHSHTGYHLHSDISTTKMDTTRTMMLSTCHISGTFSPLCLGDVAVRTSLAFSKHLGQAAIWVLGVNKLKQMPLSLILLFDRRLDP